MARPEAFAIAAGPSGGVSVAGGDARGLYYGVGKLLRGAAFGAGFASPRGGAANQRRPRMRFDARHSMLCMDNRQ